MYKYAIKRMTFGVASVAVAAGLLFAGGTMASAEEAPAEGATSEEISVSQPASAEANGSDIGTTGEVATVSTVSNVEEPKEEPAQDTVEDTQAQDNVEQIEDVKDLQLSEAQKARLRDAGYTDQEIASIEAEAKAKKQADENFDVDAFVAQKVAEKTQIQKRSAKPAPDELSDADSNALEVNESNKPEENIQQAGQEGEEKALTDDQKKKAGQSANNWDEVITSENDYWEIPKAEAGNYWKGRNMGGLTSVGYAMTELNYLGNYTDEKGNEVIRLQIKADTRSYTTSWMDNVDLAFKFQKDLFEAIDWDKSYVYSANKGEQHFNFNNVKASDYQAGISFTQINNGWINKLYELPMNLVLKKV